MPDFLLGVDIGTTGSKALLIDSGGALKASATTEYPMMTPQPQWAEQHPDEWWRSTVASIKSVIRESAILPDQIAAIGLTGQMHGLVLLDGKGAVLRPCIMWNDQRSAQECLAITNAVGESKLLELTGNPVLPGFTAPKVLWVREHEPEVYRQISKILLPKDYIRYRLTQSFLSDVSDASGTSMFDVGGRKWSDEMLRALTVPREWLPEVTESPVASSRVSSRAAKETGLREGTPVVGGAGDQAAQAVGAGVIKEGVVSVTIGTSGVVFASSDAFRPHGKLHAFCHAVPNMWHVMGVMLSAGGSFRWYRDALCGWDKVKADVLGRDAYDLLTDEAAEIPPGCDGLIFLPYLGGERTPHPDPDARGVFFGLTLRHTKAHLTRAVLEGVSFGLRDSLELMRSLGISVKQVRASGGGAKSLFWQQLLANVFNTEIVTVNVTEGAAYGAALLAGVGAGLYKDVSEACEKTTRIAGSVRPGSSAEIYEKYYRRYRSLYPALAAEFKEHARLGV
ncbi:MAG: xylulokinase [Bacteroidota bacterium]|jgi:xylulokinase